MTNPTPTPAIKPPDLRKYFTGLVNTAHTRGIPSDLILTAETLTGTLEERIAFMERLLFNQGCGN